MTAYLVMNGDGDIDTAHRIVASAIETRQARAGGPYDSRVGALQVLAVACSLGTGADLWIPFHKDIHRLGRNAPLDLRLFDRIGMDPVRTAKPMFRQLDTSIGSLYDEADLFRILQIADAAGHVDRQGELREPLWRVEGAFRNGEAAGAQAAAALGTLCTETALSGDWDNQPNT